MINPSIIHKPLTDYSNIGCLICRTPKCVDFVDNSGNHIDYHYKLIQTTDELYTYFGDPFVNPSDYAELIVAKQLLDREIFLYISSVDDMVLHDDGFDTQYNGYTEFMFLDKNGYNNVGYKLKSRIKFCQPFLSATVSPNRLDLYVNTYFFDCAMIHSQEQLKALAKSNLCQTIHVELPLSDKKITDQDIIDVLDKYDFELKVINGEGVDDALVNAFVENKSFGVRFDSYIDKSLEPIQNNIQDKFKDDILIFSNDEKYHYNVHTEMYRYNLETETDIVSAYTSAINRVAGIKPEPHVLCFDRIIKSQIVYDTENLTDDSKFIKQTTLQCDLELYSGIYNVLLDAFNSESNTYILLNTPNISSSTLLKYIENEKGLALLDNYNADIFYGYAWDYIERNSNLHPSDKIFYSTALLTFLNLMIEAAVYVTNSIIGLNISNNSVRSAISERTAKLLSESCCNSMVLFDTGYPSVYGDRSLSLSPNLRFSHISRNFVRMRRLIREYLETKKFILNTLYNQQSCVNYIRTEILELFKSQGILSDYAIEFSSKHQTIFINITLLFSAMVESINLDFTI